MKDEKNNEMFIRLILFVFENCFVGVNQFAHLKDGTGFVQSDVGWNWIEEEDECVELYLKENFVGWQYQTKLIFNEFVCDLIKDLCEEEMRQGKLWKMFCFRW